MLPKLSDNKQIKKELRIFEIYVKKINDLKLKSSIDSDIDKIKKLILEIDKIHSGYEGGALNPTLSIDMRNELTFLRKKVNNQIRDIFELK